MVSHHLIHLVEWLDGCLCGKVTLFLVKYTTNETMQLTSWKKKNPNTLYIKKCYRRIWIKQLYLVAVLKLWLKKQSFFVIWEPKQKHIFLFTFPVAEVKPSDKSILQRKSSFCLTLLKGYFVFWWKWGHGSRQRMYGCSSWRLAGCRIPAIRKRWVNRSWGQAKKASKFLSSSKDCLLKIP